ncbi:MAG TPA: hypothetical protein VJG30_02310, partial [Candidatus Nanoarchaeia archaeon]|nr:hypothetical protein [Candidatus Nanoarchaeia archaeon]
NKKPKGKYRRECLILPEFKGMRSINETVNSVLKRTQIPSLKSKKSYTKKREFGWNIILYNIKRKIKITPQKISQTFFYLTSLIYPFRTKPFFRKINVLTI